MGINLFGERQRGLRKLSEISSQGTGLKEQDSGNPVKAKFSSQNYTKGLSSTMLCVSDVQGHYPDHHNKPKPSCGREAPTAIRASRQHCLAFRIIPLFHLLENLPKLLSLHTSDQVEMGRNIFTVARDSFLEPHLTTSISRKALSAFRTETTSSTVPCTDKQN